MTTNLASGFLLFVAALFVPQRVMPSKEPSHPETTECASGAFVEIGEEASAALQENARRALLSGVTWLIENPLVVDEGVVPRGEEILVLYQLCVRGTSSAAKVMCSRCLAEQIEEILKDVKEQAPTPGDVTALLPVYEIAQELGVADSDARAVKFACNPEVYKGQYSIWNTAIAERLQLNVPIPLSQMLKSSLIRQEHLTQCITESLRSRNVSHQFMREQLYGIAHEVLALTAFGRQPSPLLRPDELDSVKQLTVRGLIFCMTHNDLDLLSELLVCSRIVSTSRPEECTRAYRFLLESQNQDGSWGGSHSPRDRRHTTLTAIWALIYSN